MMGDYDSCPFFYKAIELDRANTSTAYNRGIALSGRGMIWP